MGGFDTVIISFFFLMKIHTENMVYLKRNKGSEYNGNFKTVKG